MYRRKTSKPLKPCTSRLNEDGQEIPDPRKQFVPSEILPKVSQEQLIRSLIEMERINTYVETSEDLNDFDVMDNFENDDGFQDRIVRKDKPWLRYG